MARGAHVRCGPVLTGCFSMFAIIRAGGMPPPALLDEIRRTVLSFRAL
jgi:hypothetical protein